MTTLNKQNETAATPAKEASRLPQSYISPEVNIFENAEGYVVQAELPGVTKAGLDISVEANTLTLVGSRAQPDLKADLLYRESPTADYRRVFELDPAIDTSKIDAKLEQGVLTVRLPKSERVKPRKVTVSD
jgi:HSP20 family protein